NKQKLASMNIIWLKIFTLNILKNGSSKTIASGIKVPELDPYKISNKKQRRQLKKNHILKDLIKELSTESETLQDP
ncbi:10734_t:CDS:2, partial [Gigaspora margarita]